jgi:hypothetical protein
MRDIGQILLKLHKYLFKNNELHRAITNNPFVIGPIAPILPESL